LIFSCLFIGYVGISPFLKTWIVSLVALKTLISLLSFIMFFMRLLLESNRKDIYSNEKGTAEDTY
jgi:hypothetical protein